jgi:hypothetical protein
LVAQTTLSLVRFSVALGIEVGIRECEYDTPGTEESVGATR